MYEAHYGLKERPFGETTNPAVYIALPSRDAVIRRLHYALVHDAGPAMVIGPPGSGKTIVARRLASELSTLPVYLPFPALAPAVKRWPRASVLPSRPRIYPADSSSVKGPRRHRAARRSFKPLMVCPADSTVWPTWLY